MNKEEVLAIVNIALNKLSDEYQTLADNGINVEDYEKYVDKCNDSWDYIQENLK